MRFLLYLLWLFISLIIIILIVATVGLTVFDEEIENKLLEKVELNSGRDVDIQSMHFRFTPRPSFIFKDIKMANAPWGSKPWMLEIESVSASISVMELFRGEVILTRIDIEQPTMLVEQHSSKSSVNWDFNRQNEPKIFKRMAESLRIEQARIRDATIDVQVGQIPHVFYIDEVLGTTNFFSKEISFSARGRAHDKPIALNGNINNLKTILLREATRVQLTGRYDETNINIKGEIKDLMRWQGHDLALNARTPSLQHLQDWLPSNLIETPEISLSANYLQPQRWQTARLNDVVISSDGLAGRTELNGEIARLQDLSGIHLSGNARYPLKNILRWKGQVSNSAAMLDAAFSLSGSKETAIAFKLASASLKSKGLEVSGQGEIKNLLSPGVDKNNGRLDFKINADSLKRVGELFAKPWPESKPIKGTFTLLRDKGGLTADGIILSAFDGSISLKGRIDDLGLSQVGKFSLRADLAKKDFEQLNQLNDYKIPAFERMQIRADINNNGADINAPSVKIDIGQSGANLRAEGAISELKNLQLKGAKLAFNSKNSQAINSLFNLDLPEFGGISAEGLLDGNINKNFNINNLKVNIDNTHQVINGQGSIAQLGAKLQAKLDVSADIHSVENLPEMLGSNLQIPGKISAKGRAVLRSKAANDWSLSDVTFDLLGSNEGQIKASVLHFPHLPEIDIQADLQRINLSHLPHYTFIDIINPKNLSAHFTLHNRAIKAPASVDKAKTNKPKLGKLALHALDAQFNMQSGDVAVRVAGQIADIRALTGLDLSIALSTLDAKQIPYLQSLDLKDSLPLVASAQLSGNATALDLNFKQASIADSDFMGQLQFSNLGDSDDKLLIKGHIQANNLDILSLLQKEKRKRLFSNSPLNLRWLNSFNTDISLNATRFNGVIAQLNDAHMRILIQDSVLNLPNMNGKVGEGRMAAWLTINAQQKPYNIVSSLTADKVSPKYINLFGETQLLRGGEIDIDIGLAGNGTSMAEYMDNAYGKIQLQLSRSSIKNKNLELFGGDLVLGVLKVVNPFDRQKDYLPIECGVIHFPVVSGDAVASQGIAIKTDRVTVLGGGTMNLGTERLDVLIKPKARKGLGLSAGTLANIAKISGTFDDAKVSVDTQSILQSTAAIGVAIATGGWSLLAQGLLDRNKANSDVCQQTLNSPNSSGLLARVKTDENAAFNNETDSER